MKQKFHYSAAYFEALFYPSILLIAMWLTFWAEQVIGAHLVNYGLKPHVYSGLIGVVTMPLLHAPREIEHIINNSLPTFVLLAALIFFYREIALKVFILSWIGTGVLLWFIAQNQYAVHIGMSGVIFSLFGFLFVSGFMRDVKHLQVLTLLVGFLYGSMIWGILPLEKGISWEGHLSGLLIGIVLAIVFRKHGPQRTKLQYEIERELGIEPPDLEGQWLARQEELDRIQREWIEKQQQAQFIVYNYVPKQAEHKPQDENVSQAQQSPESTQPNDSIQHEVE